MENCIDAYKELNYKVKPIYVNKFNFFNNINRNILKKISKKISYRYVVKLIEKEIDSFNPDFILVISPFLLNKNISDLLSSYTKIIKVCWIGDKFNHTHSEIANMYNYIYYTDSHFVKEGERFSFPPGEYLPLAYNKNVFFNQNLSNRHKKLLFIGSSTKERVSFFKSLDSDSLKLVGNKWKKKLNDFNIEVINRNISIQKVAEEYNKSNFILNIKDVNNVYNGLNMRTFESIACGCCLFQDNLLDIELNFDKEKELVVYNNIEELKYKFEKLKSDTKLFNSIVQNGEKRVASEHQYIHRISTMMNHFK